MLTIKNYGSLIVIYDFHLPLCLTFVTKRMLFNFFFLTWAFDAFLFFCF